MLKFFSGRDDENESLLGAGTEGQSWGSGVLVHHCLFTYHGMILRGCAGYAESADAAFISARVDAVSAPSSGSPS